MLKRAGLLVVMAVLTGCDDQPRLVDLTVTGGDPERGRLALRQYGCGSCHRIENVPGAQGRVGPPLNHFARQAYVAGVLPNTPDNLIRWIMDPPAVDPRTAMPDLNVTEAAARDIAAALYGEGGR